MSENLSISEGQILTGPMFSCADPIIQEPIKDPARFAWQEVTKVAHYRLEVNAMTKPMRLKEELKPYRKDTP